MLDATTLAATESKEYIEGLKDPSGSLAIPVNFNDTVSTAWTACCTAYDTAKAAGKKMWFCVVHPSLTNAVYFPGAPVPLGLSAMDVDSVLSANLRIVPNESPAWFAKPTSGGTG